MPQALTFDIPISMLLKGSRGIGKFTTAMQVAQRLGMHVFEVGARGHVYNYRIQYPRLLGELLRLPWGERHEDRGVTARSL